MSEMLRAADIHREVGSTWPSILERLGIGEQFLRLKSVGGRNRGKPGPCPACGGEDRYFFDNRRGRGDFHCRGCGPGDGFELLARVFGWSFTEARSQVMQAAGMLSAPVSAPVRTPIPAQEIAPIARPSARVLSMLRSRCPITDCMDAVAYLETRGLWPLVDGCTLRAHASLEYWEELQPIGRYAGLVAEVRDVDGDLVAAHVTYLEDGRKLRGHEPRKQLGKVQGRVGCAVRLMPVTDTLAIAEGIETALSAAALFDIPAWAALNTALLARFEPPPGITRLVICADRDEAGLSAASRLMERLQGRIRFEMRVPKAPANDFNDQLNHGANHV